MNELSKDVSITDKGIYIIPKDCIKLAYKGCALNAKHSAPLKMQIVAASYL